MTPMYQGQGQHQPRPQTNWIDRILGTGAAPAYAGQASASQGLPTAMPAYAAAPVCLPSMHSVQDAFTAQAIAASLDPAALGGGQIAIVVIPLPTFPVSSP
jgi:hypothetical protein